MTEKYEGPRAERRSQSFTSLMQCNTVRPPTVYGRLDVPTLHFTVILAMVDKIGHLYVLGTQTDFALGTLATLSCSRRPVLG
jgi:hypothetical protein